ncbi:hypothetical protein B484DRAFT_404238, partial [Ochromonadaceae sp. CCMP2298]
MSKRPREQLEGRQGQQGQGQGQEKSIYGPGSRPSSTPLRPSATPSRSGIGLDTDEWEAPERLSTSIKRSASSTATPLTSMESQSQPSSRKDEWEKPTPLRGATSTLSTLSSSSSSSSSKPRTVLNSKLIERLGYHSTPAPQQEEQEEEERRYQYDRDEEDEDFDRDFYLSEEGVAAEGEGGFLGSEEKFRQREEAMGRSRAKGATKIAGMSAKKSQLYVDQEAWEENRLLQSGVASLSERQMDFDNEDDSRITLIVHNVKPPFLDGRVAFSLQQSTVSILKDPTGDMAVNARKGSLLLRNVREKRDVMKMRKRFWELGGSRMGGGVGIPAGGEEEEKGGEAVQ